MSYVEEEIEVVFRENSLHIKYTQAADTMGLDRSTVTSLEILQNIRHAKGTSSTLFGLLNNTLTPQGRRLIRSTLLQPSTSHDVITERHGAVEELSSSEDMFREVRGSLKRLLHIDIERSVPWVTLRSREPRHALQNGVALIEGHHQIVMPNHEELQEAEKDLNHILMIKAYLGGIRSIQETLEVADCTSKLCKWVLERCGPENTAQINALLEGAIEQDATWSKAPIDIRNNRLWAFKAEPNSVLERARHTYRDLTNEMHEYVEGLNKVFQEHLSTAPELRLGNDNHYYLRFQWSDVEREVTRHLAAASINNTVGVQHWRQRVIGGVETVNGIRRKKHYDCQTVELIQKSSRIQRQADVVTAQSDKYVVELKKSLLDYAQSLLNLSEATAVLDMLCSFAHLATTQNYVRPIITDNLVLKAARHPVVEVRKPNFVPNDVYSGDQGARFKVITGGNMSGKSTFIRSIAMIQVLAQIGSFVPAQYAAIPICDRLFTRLSTEDKPEGNLGTFAVEMTEMNVILRQVTKDSLVIIDELGRGTSTKEGLALALAMSEKLIETGCRVFFATHFTELARVLNSTKRNNVLNVHVVGESITKDNILQITLPHTIASGPVKNEDYGLDLARRFLPERVIKNAEQICQFLRHKSLHKATGPATKAMKQNKLILALPDLLKQANTSTMDESALASYLKKLQIEFTIRMNLAAKDDVEGVEEGGNPGSEMEHPVLEKPSKEELLEWKNKCDSAEKRVMHANMAHSQGRKRPTSGDELRNKTISGIKSVPQLKPINRGSIIEELRREACFPTNREDTPSSFTMDIQESCTESVIGETVLNLNLQAQGVGDDQNPISISSDSSNSQDDDEMLDSTDVMSSATFEKASGELPEKPSEPLQQFQPLKQWYARNSQTGM
ncbi:hypothetical protein BT67DRAFT_443453 [Trichocladium antarcticum]|uniref:DNA mismatch repair protein MSH3 n=1 Tax=Trichocladium antarcticum TaxID=1450529 RepID=A0AAN6UGT3_9PEZI|nr:hypothetical protein BT67DRAFT_443453 [Trichocladium antarcticum]